MDSRLITMGIGRSLLDSKYEAPSEAQRGLGFVMKGYLAMELNTRALGKVVIGGIVNKSVFYQHTKVGPLSCVEGINLHDTSAFRKRIDCIIFQR